MDRLLENDEQLADQEAQEGFLDFRLLRLHDDRMLVDAVRRNLAQIRQRKQIKMPDHRTRKSVIDFQRQGFYHRFGAAEEEALSAFNFLDDYSMDSSDDLSDPSTAAAPATESPIPMNHSLFIFEEGDDSPRSTPEPKKGNIVSRIMSSNGKINAFTPDINGTRKHNTKNLGEANSAFIYGTPSAGKKIIVRASSTLATSPSPTRSSALRKKARPKSTEINASLFSEMQDWQTETSTENTTANKHLPAKTKSTSVLDSTSSEVMKATLCSEPENDNITGQSQPYRTLSKSPPSKKYIIKVKSSKKKSFPQSPQIENIQFSTQL